MDFPGRILAAFLAVLLITIFPLQYVANNMEDNLDSQVGNCTEQLSDTIRTKGYLDTHTYETFVKKLDNSGELYDIEIEDIHPVTGEEVSQYDGDAFATLSYQEKGEHKCLDNACGFESGGTPLKLIKSSMDNEPLQLSNDNNEIQSLASHSHTSDCYAGHRHVDTYGNTDLTNMPVYLTREYVSSSNEYSWMYYKYSSPGYLYTVRCTHCATELYKLLYTFYTGGGATFTYDQNGTVAEIAHQWSGSVEELKTYFENVLETKSANTGDNRRTSDFAYPYNYFPVFHSAGVAYTVPFRCHAIEKHPNSSGCFPIGKTDGQYTLSASYSPAFNNDGTLDIRIYCQTCGSAIHSTQVIYDNHMAHGPYSSGIMTSRLIYNRSGQSVTQHSNGSMSYNNISTITFTDINLTQLTAKAWNAITPIKDQVLALPRATFWTDTQSFSMSTPYLPYSSFAHLRFPVLYSPRNASQVVWEPFLGCTKCAPKGDRYSCGQMQDETPICNQVVTAITATNPTQTVNKGEGINATAVATYQDGHTGIVNCSVSGFDTNQVGNQTVTLTYYGLVGNAKTTGTRTCTVAVTVKNNKLLEYITATPASQTIAKYGTPIYSIRAYYSDGTNSALSASQCTITPINTSTAGSKTITISYYEAGITKSTSITVYVDDIVSISITPLELTVSKYTGAYSLPITITGTYLYTGSRVITSGYTITGYNEATTGRQTITVSYTESGNTVTSTTIINVIPLRKACAVCGTVYDLKPDDSDPGCPVCKSTVVGISVTPDDIEVFQGSSLPITVQVLYQDGITSTVTNWTSNYSANTIGIQFVEVMYAGYTTMLRVLVKEHEVTCSNCGTSYPVSEGTCPVCREKVVSILVVPEEITVNQYDIINLTVIATYADGSVREVEDWSIDCTTSTAGVFTANVAYGGCSYPIKLTVLSPDLITCPICCLSYDGGEFPNGCPVCSKTITAIEAYLTSGSNLVQFGSMPSLSVVLIFLDGHREITDTDYSIEGYDPYRMGIQTITVKYDTFYCLLEIEVVDTLASVVCPNGHVYFLNEDGSDPGCPYCVVADAYEVVYYYDITYTYEILEVLYNDGIYYFGQDNYLNISVTKKEVSLLRKMQRFSVKTVLLGRRKKYIYGGKVM